MVGDVLGRPSPGADAKPLPYVASQTRKLPSGAEYHIHTQSRNADEENGAVVMFFQSGLPAYTGVGDDADALKRTAAMRVLGGMIKEPLFNTLRTKQQLGYIVSGYAGSTMSVSSEPTYDVSKVEDLNVTVVSKKVSPGDVVEAIDEFLAGFKATLQSMPASELKTHKAR